MEVRTNEDSVVAGTSRENEGNEIASINLVPEGFVEEDAIPSIHLEDFGGDKRFWLVEIPIAVDPIKLLGKNLDYTHQISFLIDEENNERCVSIPTSESIDLICLLKSSGGGSSKTVALNSAGKISINASYDVPDVGAMIPDGKSVPLPTGLKVRNPFLGLGELPNHGQRMSMLTCKAEVLTPKKKSKKRKQESMDESEGINESNGRVGISHANDLHIRKKVKREMGEMKGNDSSSIIKEDLSAVGAELEMRSPAKKKAQISQLVDNMVPSEDFREEPKNAEESTVHTPKKGRKKKRDLQHGSRSAEDSPSEVSVSCVGGAETIKRIKKEKRQESSQIVVDGGTAEEFLVTFDDGGQSRKKTKKGKNPESYVDNEETVAVVDLDENEDVPQEVMYGKRKVKRERKRDSLALSEVVDDQVSQGDITVTYDGSSEPRVRKIKKEKKRHSQLSSEEVVTDISQGDLSVTFDDGGLTRKKARKEKMQGFPVGIEESATVNSAEEVVPGESVITKKTKKERKRYSQLLSGEVATVDQPVDVKVNYDGPCEQTSKKVKREKKRDSHYSGHDVPTGVSEEELAVTFDNVGQVSKSPNKEKKNYIGSNVSAIDNSREEFSVIYDGVEVASKKAKKKKKRDSEHVGEVVTLDLSPKNLVCAEVGGVTLQKAKKKSDQFLDVGDSCNDLVVDFDGSVVRKKIKKDKLNSTILSFDSGEGFGNLQGLTHKKSKRRHTMDNIGMKSVHLHSETSSVISEGTIEGRSAEKKKKNSVSAHELEICLVSPKKEKKIKKESIESETPLLESDSLHISTEKKKKKRKSMQPGDIML